MTTWRNLVDAFRRKGLTGQFDEELRFHRDHIVEEQVAAGRSAVDAEYDARRRLGNTTMLSEEVRTVWSFRWFEQLMQDARYGLRALRRSPGFTTVAALTLALGIGANTAIFTVVNGVVFRPLPFEDPGRVVMLWETMKDLPQVFVSYPNYRDWRGRPSLQRSFEDVALYNGYGNASLTGMGITPAESSTARLPVPPASARRSRKPSKPSPLTSTISALAREAASAGRGG